MTNNSTQLLKNVLTMVQTAPTLTAVADWLYTTQPNISKIISEAEKKYQIKLVQRNKTPISLTEAGTYLLKRLEYQLNYEEETIEDLKNFTEQKIFPVHLAFFPTYSQILLPLFYQEIIQRYPTIRLYCDSLTTSSALEKFKNGKVDIFIGRNAADPDIISTTLFTEQLCFVISNKSKLFQKQKFIRELQKEDLIELQKENYIKWTTESSFIEVTNHFMTLNDLHFHSNLTVSTYEEAMILAAKGLGITIAMTKTAETFLNKNKQVNLINIPLEMASLSISTMTLNSASKDIHNLSNEISNIITEKL